ncbi:hypothetical protein [Roseivirga sp.]|uniref:hypothetical protein n=1 Tax=Roseivirga sp. TaxID=1964215 RepID=UPI002B26F4AB|nr:hypothetical protein [Roseivirga sp.]
MYLQQPWSGAQKIGFRFTFIFFLLFILPFPFSTIFGVFNLYFLDQFFSVFWNGFAQLIANTFLGIGELATNPTGSGDKTIDWIFYISFFALAIIGSIIWTALDRKRTNYYRLWRIFVMIVVYYLVYYMAIYGFIKIFWLQMPELHIDRLLKTYGQSSPMGLLWTFMGASKTYSVYAGLSEVIAGTLLLFKRTRTLGGLVTFGVMFNVFMMNMAYDVPVKLFSAQLMIMGLYIAMIDYKAIFGLLIFRKSEAPIAWPPFFKSPRNNAILLAVMVLFVVYTYYQRIDAGISGRSQYGELRPKSSLYGLYDVEHFVQNGDTVPPLMTDDIRWQRMIFDSPVNTQVMYMDDRLQYYTTQIDTVERLITFKIGRDSLQKSYNLNYEKLEDGMTISGVFESDTLNIRLKTYDLSNFYLTNRGFHLLNEVPWHRYDPRPKPNW